MRSYTIFLVAQNAELETSNEIAKENNFVCNTAMTVLVRQFILRCQLEIILFWRQ